MTPHAESNAIEGTCGQRFARNWLKQLFDRGQGTRALDSQCGDGTATCWR